MGSKFIKVHKYSFQFVSKQVCNGERGMYMEGFLVGKVCMFPKTNQNDYLCYMFFWGNYLFLYLIHVIEVMNVELLFTYVNFIDIFINEIHFQLSCRFFQNIFSYDSYVSLISWIYVNCSFLVNFIHVIIISPIWPIAFV